jgi:hypothetical protein
MVHGFLAGDLIAAGRQVGVQKNREIGRQTDWLTDCKADK